MSDKPEVSKWARYGPHASINRYMGNHFQITGEPDVNGNWFGGSHIPAEIAHDFVFEINGEYFEMTGVEMLEALRAHAAARVIKGERG